MADDMTRSECRASGDPRMTLPAMSVKNQQIADLTNVKKFVSQGAS